MFTGIVENLGTVEGIEPGGSNKTFWINSPISHEFTIDQSVCHNGVCLTVEEVSANGHRVTAIDETLKKTNLDSWKEGALINLERCLKMNGRLDGHIVQGHVDTVALCKEIVSKDGSWECLFEFDDAFAAFVIEKGSITVNGISLTVFNVTNNSFQVGIIPYTFEHTNMQTLLVNDKVNIEFDMIGKYVNRFMQLK